MKKTIVFYTKEQKDIVKTELAKGIKPVDIARKYCKQFNRKKENLLAFIYYLNKGNKMIKVPKETIVLPSGFSFDFKPSSAEMHKDHIKLYF